MLATPARPATAHASPTAARVAYQVLDDSQTAASPAYYSGVLAPLIGAVIALIIVAVAVLVLLGLSSVVRYYNQRIVPGVTVGGFTVGVMTTQDAMSFLQQQYARKVAILMAPDKQFVASWGELGVSVDPAETVQRAYAIGRSGDLGQRVRSWLGAKAIQPSLSFDPSVAAAYLQAHSPDLCTPPSDASVTIQDGVATATPAVPGCVVDTQATLSDLYSAMIREQSIPVRTRQVFPVVDNANPAVDQINRWLTQPFTLNLWFNNSLTTRTIAPRERMSWMQTSVETRGLVADLNVDGIGATLAEVTLELGPDTDLRKVEAAGIVRSAMLRGDLSAWLVVPRKQVRYSVQAGDTFDHLADEFGIPSPRLMAANPDVSPDGLMVGQSIVIPAQSNMLPVAIQPDNLKHIEIDLATQHLYAYDGAQAVLTATISSGIPKWRTLEGVYQVEEKQAEAYNSLAHVRMPNWMSIYDLAEPGSTSNGIHALPILQSGQRLWSGYLGTPVSFGCIVMGIQDSDFLYTWADVGTPVVIHGNTPPSPFNYDNLVEAQKKA